MRTNANLYLAIGILLLCACGNSTENTGVSGQNVRGGSTALDGGGKGHAKDPARGRDGGDPDDDDEDEADGGDKEHERADGAKGHEDDQDDHSDGGKSSQHDPDDDEREDGGKH